MSALDVLLGDTRVGRLERLDEWQYRFSFDAAWLADPSHPVLGQIFEDRKPRDLESTGTLPCWFDHLLPPQNGPLRRAISRQIKIEEDDDFALLSFLGADLPGAVVLVPGEPTLAPKPRATPPPKPEPEGPLRFSLAGAQWKLSVREQDRKLTLPLRGETGGAIAKLPSPTFADLPRVELATMRWAALSGIDVPPVRLAQAADIVNLPEGIPVGDGTIYVIERFDRRPDGGRVHIEDFGQVLDRPADNRIYDARYEHVAAFLSYLPREDLRAFCERLVFSILAGNGDAHVKNWSLIYPDGRRPRLAPAYDLVATVVYGPLLKQEIALTLAGSRRFQDVSLDAFRPLAVVARQSFDDVSTWVREMVDRVLAAWTDQAAEIPFSAEERARIAAHLASVPLARRAP
jgi:serine/threonine-protein kinase HipA